MFNVVEEPLLQIVRTTQNFFTQVFKSVFKYSVLFARAVNNYSLTIDFFLADVRENC